MKHTEKTLLKHPKVREIINPKTVICICGKKFVLIETMIQTFLTITLKIKHAKVMMGTHRLHNFFQPKIRKLQKKENFVLD
jgi:hypothetical protein